MADCQSKSLHSRLTAASEQLLRQCLSHHATCCLDERNPATTSVAPCNLCCLIRWMADCQPKSLHRRSPWDNVCRLVCESPQSSDCVEGLPVPNRKSPGNGKSQRKLLIQRSSRWHHDVALSISRPSPHRDLLSDVTTSCRLF